MSSTSWSEDERIDMLLEALKKYEDSNIQTHLYIFITGDGPLRRQYETQIESLHLSKSTIVTCWLASKQEYFGLIGKEMCICLF